MLDLLLSLQSLKQASKLLTRQMSAGQQHQLQGHDGIAVLEGELQGLLESLLELGVCKCLTKEAGWHTMLHMLNFSDA